MQSIDGCLVKSQVLKAAGITTPPGKESRNWCDVGLVITCTEQGDGSGGFVVMDKGNIPVEPNKPVGEPPEGLGAYNSARMYPTGSEVLKAVRWPVGTAHGDSIREWLRNHGWKSKQELELEAQEQTRMIT